MKYSKAFISISRASYKHTSFLYYLHNDPVVRKNSFNRQKTQWNAHQKWMCEVCSQRSTNILYIGYFKSAPIGFVKFQIKPFKSIVSFAIMENYRGLGISKDLLTNAIDTYRNEINRDAIEAKVFNFNNLSKKLLYSVGFKLIKRFGKHSVLLLR